MNNGVRLAARLGLVTIVTIAAAGCGRSDAGDRSKASPLLDAPDPAAITIDVERAAGDPEELARALSAPHAATAGRLGAHRFKGTSKLRVLEQTAEVTSLDEEAVLEVAADGSFHALYTNSKDYGRETFHHDGRLWLRPRYGKFHRRPIASPDEPGSIAARTFGTLGAHFELVAGSAALSDGGVASVGGRSGRRIAIQAGPKRSRPPETLPRRTWRDEITVESLEGEVVLDAQTGAPLAGTLRARIAFVRDGRSFTMSLDTTHNVTDVGGAIAIAAPSDADSVDTPVRSGELEDRDALLEGIAPPAGQR